ncbi:MrcB family domain-containing protein, partial [Leuconostoc mesenteroides]
GFDIVYLFSPDMSSVYLSLNQGWTFFNDTYGRNAKNNISKVSRYWQSTLANRTDRMTTEPIDLTSSLHNKNNLVSGYELG